MTIFASNGTKLFIGGVMNTKSTDFVEADYTPQTWVEIGEIEALGTVGDSAAEITFDSMSAGRTRRLKGTRNAGTTDVVCALDYNDPGQLAAIAAERTPHDYAFRMVLNDAPPGGTPSERLFVAKVASASESYDTANSVVKLNLTLWVNGNVVRNDAEAA